MLPTRKAEKCLILNQGVGTRTLKWYNNYLTQEYLQQIYAKSFHLYFFIDEKPKANEWYYDVRDNILSNNSLGVTHFSKKVIAATDKELLKPYSEQTLNDIAILPQPSNSFISKYISEYNKENIIKEVMVDYQSEYFDEKGNPFGESYLKVDKNNSITITRCKEVWSRKEVESLIRQFSTDVASSSNNNFTTTSEWIEQNL